VPLPSWPDAPACSACPCTTVQILVIGVIIESGVAPVEPTKLFSVLKVDEREA
jgi:hypothetical protein